MTINEKQLIDFAIQAGFTNEDYGLNTWESASEFNGKIGVEEYACGEKLLKLLELLGIEVTI